MDSFFSDEGYIDNWKHSELPALEKVVAPVWIFFALSFVVDI